MGMEAIRRAGMEPKLCSIRGGTDGSRLSFMGLPTPNIFAGEHAFHSKQEWVIGTGYAKSSGNHFAFMHGLGRRVAPQPPEGGAE
jgi:di/tripeptidase